MRFACGLFSEWDIYTVVDPVLQGLEDSVQGDAILSNDIDRIHEFIRYPIGGPVPVTRPLPIANVSICGDLLPSRVKPLYGMSLLL